MHAFDRAYCPSCDETNKIVTKRLLSNCSRCKEVIKHPECLSKSSFELIADMNTKKTIPWWGWGVLVFMILGFVIEVAATYAYPVLQVYLKADHGKQKIEEVKTRAISSDYKDL